MIKSLKELEDKINYNFKDKTLLHRALTIKASTIKKIMKN